MLELFGFFLPVNSEEKQISSDEHKFNFYSGMFDFSDNGKRATIFGLERQNENLFEIVFRNTFSGNWSFNYSR